MLFTIRNFISFCKLKIHVGSRELRKSSDLYPSVTGVKETPDNHSPKIPHLSVPEVES